MPPDVQMNDLLTGPQAGLILNKSARTVQRMAHAGLIPVEQKLPGPNGAFLYRRDVVEQMAAAAERASA
ncbi:MAG TPA: hypothetical protein VGH54_21215 [Mycobacterium sp.]|jgi:hypothetical protein|uniref:hypothetical protein n=1 Tax=Mycobacterium sp. TaxID=1785 RepID=UPI002F3E744B